MAGLIYRPIFSGNWNNGANCGSRSANWNNSALNLNTNIGARGVAETKGQTLRLIKLASPQGRIQDGGLPGTVGGSEPPGRHF